MNRQLAALREQRASPEATLRSAEETDQSLAVPN